jgi:hypothetical protein
VDLRFTDITLGGKELGALHLVVTASAMYLSSPAVVAGDGKPWVGAQLAGAASRLDPSIATLLLMAHEVQPGESLTALAGVHGTVFAYGPETVDGRSTTDFTGVVSFDQMLAGFPPKVRTRIGPALLEQGINQASLDAWVDTSGLVRRVTWTVESLSSTITVTADFLDYGVADHVSPPPPGQVTNTPRLLTGTD